MESEYSFIGVPGARGIAALARNGTTDLISMNRRILGIPEHAGRARELLHPRLTREQITALSRSAQLKTHTDGRAEVTAKILVNVAYIRSEGFVRDNAVVAPGGSRYQDIRGSAEHPAAHRAVCNPIIGFRSLPDIVPWSFSALRQVLKQPLAEVDILPAIINAADRRFEIDGAVSALITGVGEVLHAQQPHKPISSRVIANEILERLWMAFDHAYERAIDTLDEADMARMVLIASRTHANSYRPLSSREDKISEHFTRLQWLTSMGRT